MKKVLLTFSLGALLFTGAAMATTMTTHLYVSNESSETITVDGQPIQPGTHHFKLADYADVATDSDTNVTHGATVSSADKFTCTAVEELTVHTQGGVSFRTHIDGGDGHCMMSLMNMHLSSGPESHTDLVLVVQ